MAVVVNPGLDRSSMQFVLTIRMVKFGNVLRRMPFLTQPSLFIRAWDRHRSHWTVTPMARLGRDGSWLGYMAGRADESLDSVKYGELLHIWKFPNQKPWINSQVRHMLRARSFAFTSGNETEYKAAKYGLRKDITVAKRQYREKLDSFYSNADAGRMWQGLQRITDYRPTTSTTISSLDSLPDDLNTFYACFETSSDNTEWRHTHIGTTQSPFSPPTVCSCGTQSTEEDQPPKGSGARQHPWAGPQSLCYRGG
ncbi:hypothetical protein QTP86_002036 [Hemibagrus guttatus]|nr:hypothetical protein QTP86_002036 [Hemibagrus guttatus]